MQRTARDRAARLAAAAALLSLALAVASILWPPAPASAAAGSPEFFELPPATHAGSMTAGPEGAMWFTGAQAPEGAPRMEVVGRVDVSGAVKLFDLPPRRTAGGIVAGADGNLWFSETYENKKTYLVARIGRMSPSGEFTEWSLGNHVGAVGSLAVGPSGSIWFTTTYWVHKRKQAAVGRIDAAGKVTRFQLPVRSGPGGIVAGPEGNLWFTERGAGTPKIGRVTPGGQVTDFPLPGHGRVPTTIVAGAEGNLWFGEQTTTYGDNFNERIGRATPAGQITEIRVPGSGYTAGLAPKPDGGVWYSSNLNVGPLGIGSVATDGTSVGPQCVRPVPCETDADTLAVGADGSLWFAASTYYSHGGGGGTGLYEGILEEAEAGFVGRYPPGSTP